MTELPNWNKYLVMQCDPELGCIPTGIEWMLRTVEFPGIDFAKFQDEFNLQANGRGANDFVSIANAVQAKYPNVKIEHREFAIGEEKVAFVRYLLEKGIPCLLSLALQPSGRWHIMPIIYIDDRVMKTIWSVGSDGKPVIHKYSLADIVNRHNRWAGGKDVAWLSLMEDDLL